MNNPKSRRSTNPKSPSWKRLVHEIYESNRERFGELVRQLYRNGIVTVILAMVLLAFVGAFLGFAFESYNATGSIKSFPSAVWWAIVTMTTTGYGDMYPVTWSGRGAGILLMFGGIALVAIFSATISSVFIVMRLREGRGLQKVHWTEHIVVCGWNAIAGSLLDTLARNVPHQRIVIISQMNADELQNLQERYHALKLQFVTGDETQEETLKRANLSEAHTVLILSPEGNPDGREILVALAIRAVNKEARVYAQVSDHRNIFHLKRAGVDEVVWVAPYAGYLMATHALLPGIPQVYDSLMNPREGSALERIPITKEWIGKTFGEYSAHYRKQTGAMIIGLIKDTATLSAGDILSHDISTIDEFIRRKSLEAGLITAELEGEQVRMNPSDDTILQQRDVAVALPLVSHRKE